MGILTQKSIQPDNRDDNDDHEDESKVWLTMRSWGCLPGSLDTPHSTQQTQDDNDDHEDESKVWFDNDMLGMSSWESQHTAFNATQL